MRQTYYCTDSVGILSPSYSTDGAEVVPAGGSTTRQRTGAAAARFFKLCEAVRQAEQLSAKLDLAAELLARDSAMREQQEARRDMKIGSLPGVLSETELADQWRKAYEAREAQICADAKAAYDARNPHKRKGGAT